MVLSGIIKDLIFYLKHFPACKEKDKSLRLIVAGEFYTDSKPYFEIIKKYKLEEYVIMHNDFIPDEEVAEYFCAADIVVQPYKDATQSGVTQIAYHYCKPMIVTDVGGLAEIVPHGRVGYVVKPNAAEISNAILDFYNGNKAEEFSINAGIEKEKYSWEKMIDAIKSLLK